MWARIWGWPRTPASREWMDEDYVERWFNGYDEIESKADNYYTYDK
jgi:hypothetical protein